MKITQSVIEILAEIGKMILLLYQSLRGKI